MNLLEINLFILGFRNPVAMKLQFSWSLRNENQLRPAPPRRFCQFSRGGAWLHLRDGTRQPVSPRGVHPWYKVCFLECQIFVIWVKLPWTDIFPKNCHFFCNFDSCFQALFALVWLFQLFLRVNHMCHSRENQVFDPSPQVRYLKKTSKHGRFWGF